MVRHKTRWLLVRLENADSLAAQQTATLGDDDRRLLDYDNNNEILQQQRRRFLESYFPFSKKDLHLALQQHLNSVLGLSSGTIDMQVRFWDATTRLLLIRVPREDCSRVRASLTVWTQLEMVTTMMTTTSDRNHTKTSSNSNNLHGRKSMRIMASTLSVNGSARTAKRAAMFNIRQWYHRRIQLEVRQSNTKQHDNNGDPKNYSSGSMENERKRKMKPTIFLTESRVVDKESKKLQELLSIIQCID